MDTMLPIGSVVELDGFKDYIVIIGFFPSFIDSNEITIYQYVGCNYLKGYRSEKDYIFFDESKIKNVYFIGYAIDFDFKFLKVLYEVYKEMKTGKNIDDVINKVCKKISPNNPKELEDLKNKILNYYFGEEEPKAEQGV